MDYQKIEQQFVEASFSEQNGFLITPGKNRILLSAPHSAAHIRNGKPKTAEYRTGLILSLLGEMTDCHLIFKTQNLNDDANYDAKSPYRDALVDYMRVQDLKLLLDFHLSAPERHFDIDIGTGRGKNIMGRQDLLVCLKNHLKQTASVICVDDTFPASFAHTVSSTAASALDIPAFQIEINWNLVSTYEKAALLAKQFSFLLNDLEALL